MKQALLIPLLLLLASSVQAQEQGSFIYAKTILKIIPKAGGTLPEPAVQDKGKTGAPAMVDPAALMPTLKRAPKEFTVALRPASFLQQRDFISLQPFADKEGMLILIDPPKQTDLTGTRLISTADVLFIDPDGIIIKIAPRLKLTGLTEPIPSDKPIRAFVYLKAGAVESYDIQLGDRIENPYFKTHPVVIE